jgi:hypothetical protein
MFIYIQNVLHYCICHVLICHARLCYMLCFVILCYGLLCYVMLCMFCLPPFWGTKSMSKIQINYFLRVIPTLDQYIILT